MTEFSPEQTSTDASVVSRLDGRPKPEEGEVLTRRDFVAFKVVTGLLKEKIGEYGTLAERYATALVDQEANSARKTLAEAGELAAKKELIESQAHKTRQEAFGLELDNIERIDKLNGEAKIVAMMKYFNNEPEVLAQLQIIEEKCEYLRLVHGTDITILSTSREQSSGEPEE